MRSIHLGAVVAVVAAAAAVLALRAFAEDAGSYTVAINEVYTVPGTLVTVSNNSSIGLTPGAVTVEWDDGSTNIRVTAEHDTSVSINSAGTPVAAKVSGDNAAITGSGGSISLTYLLGTDDSTATLAGDGNSVLYEDGSSGNATTCTGNNNVSKSLTDPDLVLGNATMFDSGGPDTTNTAN